MIARYAVDLLRIALLLAASGNNVVMSRPMGLTLFTIPSRKLMNNGRQRSVATGSGAGDPPMRQLQNSALRMRDESEIETNNNNSAKPVGSSKSDLYSNDELLDLLNIHNNLFESVPEFNSREPETNLYTITTNGRKNEETPPSLSLQDVIKQTIQDIDGASTKQRDGDSYDTESSILHFESSFEVSDFRRIIPNIRAIASDVDGTLLSSDHSLHEATRVAIQNAVQAAFSPMHPLQYFFPATGKTRAGALKSLGPEMEALLSQVPGVYVQGLYCVDAAGNVVFEKKLSNIAVEEAETLAKSCGVSLIAYDGNELYITKYAKPSHVDEVSMRWGEHVPILLEGTICSHKPGFHKILFMGDDAEEIGSSIRPKLEALAASLDCVVTQAIPVMLELLPAGCSKAVGVEKLCEVLGLDLSTQVCAIGDAENDIDMIRLAAIGVAVGNAAEPIKDVSDVVMMETNDQGGAGRAIELFGLGKVLKHL